MKCIGQGELKREFLKSFSFSYTGSDLSCFPFSLPQKDMQLSATAAIL